MMMGTGMEEKGATLMSSSGVAGTHFDLFW